MDQPSFNNLLAYFGVCGGAFLVMLVIFIVYKNLRTPSVVTDRPHSSSILLPALPEADLFLMDLVKHVYTHNDRALRQDVKVEGLIFLRLHRQLLLVVLGMCAAGAIVLVPTYLQGSKGSEAWEINNFTVINLHENSGLLWVPLGVLILFSGVLTHFMFRFRSKVRAEILHADGGVAARTVEFTCLSQHSDVTVLADLLHNILHAQFSPPMSSPDPIETVSVVPDLNLAYSTLLKLKRALKIRRYYMEREEIEGGIVQRKRLCRSIPAVEYYNKKITELQKQYKDTMAVHHLSLGVAYVTLRSRSLMLHLYKNFNRSAIPPDLNPSRWKIHKAPNPKEILWANLTKPKTSKTLFANLIFILIFFIVLTPLAFEEYVLDALRWMKITFLQFYITPIMIYAYQQVVLHRAVEILVDLEKHTRSSHASISVFYKYYFFSLVYGYLLPMLGIQTTQVLVKLFQGSDHHWTVLLRQAVQISGFTFTEVIINHCFVSNGLDLLQHWKYIGAVFRAAKAKLPDDRVRAFEASPFPFGSSYAESLGVLLLVASHGIVYPLILPFGLLYFAMRLAIQKYNILCFYVVTFDSFGRVAKHMSVAIAVAAFAMQVFTLLELMLIGTGYSDIVCLCLLVVSGVQLPVSLYLSRKCGGTVDEDHSILLATEPVARCYDHPCLQREDE